MSGHVDGTAKAEATIAVRRDREDGRGASAPVLRRAQPGPGRSRIRCARGDAVRAGVRAEEPGRSAVVGARRVLPHVVAGVLRGDRVGARDLLAMRGLALAEALPGIRAARVDARPLNVVTHAHATARVDVRGGLPLRDACAQRARSAARPGGWGGCDLPSRRCVDEDHRAEGQRRGLQGLPAQARQGVRHREPDRRGAAPLRPKPRRQEDVE